MAKIGIDAHAIGERLTGNETYIANLVDELLAIDSGHEFVLFFTNPLAALKWRQKHAGARVILARPRNPFIRIPLVMPWLSWRLGIDLLHVQYAGPPFLTAPLITMIHDISYEHYPQFFTRKQVIQYRATIPHTARQAARVLTVSEYSKRDLVETYGIPEQKVVVTYDGVSPRFVPVSADDRLAVTGKYGIPGKYLLTVGNLQPRKNLVRLITAYTRLREARPDIQHKLVIVGKKAWKFSPVLAFVSQSKWADEIILTDYVPDGDLPALYSGADAFAYPSIFEGFGLPPLEAMACGTPVVVSDRSSLPEVVGDAGLKVDPFDVNGIAAALAALLLEPELARHFRNKGLERAKKFRWADSAAKTLEVYEEVLREVG